MFLNFIDREDELLFLNQRYGGADFEFFVIYGRRRIGKTELIKEFVKGKDHIYFLCDKRGTASNATRFKKAVSEFLKEPVLETSDLPEIIGHLVKRAASKRIILCFDEFTYLAEKDDAIPSVLQSIVDEVLAKTGYFLILCGSSVTMMEKGVLSHKSPLYGRKTAHIKLHQIGFQYLAEFYPQNSFMDNLQIYFVLGGVPFYLEKFAERKGIWDNIQEQILVRQGRLYEEIDFLLKEELREPDVYKAILEAIASGRTKSVDIANKSGVKQVDLDRYLKVLISLGFIRREQPVTELKGKKSIYIFNDNFSNFWFAFCEPNKSYLEIGDMEMVGLYVKQRLNGYFGKRFEEFIRKEVLVKACPFRMKKAGRWWGHIRAGNMRTEIEIDVVAINDDTKDILFAECKWQEDVDAEKILKELKEKAKHVKWHDEDRKEHYAIFAKSFKNPAIAEFLSVKLYDIGKIEKMLR